MALQRLEVCKGACGMGGSCPTGAREPLWWGSIPGCEPQPTAQPRGEAQALGSCLRGVGYLDPVVLQEMGKTLEGLVAHVMYWSLYTPAAHPARGPGCLIRWHPSFREIGRDAQPSGRGFGIPELGWPTPSNGGMLPGGPGCACHLESARPAAEGLPCFGGTSTPTLAGPRGFSGDHSRVGRFPAGHRHVLVYPKSGVPYAGTWPRLHWGAGSRAFRGGPS